MSETATIYALCDDTGIRYIGQTEQTPERRLRQHLAGYPGCPSVVQWVQALAVSGQVPMMRVLEVVDVDLADAAEVRHIAEARAAGCHLLNRKTGGGGRRSLDVDWNVMLRLPRSTRREIERRARQTRTPVAVLLRAWVLERADAESGRHGPA